MNLIATDKKRIVLGLGQTGLSCARFLCRHGLSFSVLDSREAPPGLAEFKLEFPEVAIATGAWDEAALLAADELLVSPGISLREPAIAAALQAGVRVYGDIELFAQYANAPVAAISGSNGKSTVTTLLGNMAQEAGLRVAVGGNLGTPALDLLDDSVELYVIELSSFQLERCSHLGAAVATVLNISEDHLDHHGNLVAYHRAKHRIFESVKAVVINGDDPLSRPLIPDAVARRIFRSGQPDLNEWGIAPHHNEDYLCRGSEPVLPVSAMRMVGRHNASNALAALAMGELLGLPRAAMCAALVSFTGLPHRCQFVAEVNRIAYFDDSKGTNVGAAVAAMSGVAESRGKLVLIAGGRGKGGSYSLLMDCLQRVGTAAVFIGETAAGMQQELDGRLPSAIAGDMDEAVQAASKMASPGESVLLSPACASFDQYPDYMARGRAFQSAVAALSAGGQP